MRLTIPAAIVVVLLLAAPTPTTSLVCEPAAGHIAEAIQSGWPPDAPHAFVFIATVGEITPIKGDSHTWGDIVQIRVDGVLRGDLRLTTTQLYNPPLDASGWGPFRSGAQYLISANPSEQDMPGQVYTTMCSPNEQITSAARFNELIAYAETPLLADTALPGRRSDPSALGWLFVGAAAVLGVAARARWLRQT